MPTVLPTCTRASRDMVSALRLISYLSVLSGTLSLNMAGSSLVLTKAKPSWSLTYVFNTPAEDMESMRIIMPAAPSGCMIVTL